MATPNMPPDVTLFGQLAAIFGEIDIGSIEIALCGYGPYVPKVQGAEGRQTLSLITQIKTVVAEGDDAGIFSTGLYSNGIIVPDGTYYTITVKDFNGDIVQCEAYVFGPGSFDLALLKPFDPNLPPPPLPQPILNLLLVVPYTTTPDFPGDIYTSWQITLNGDAWPTFTNLVDGNLYTIIVIQDAIGERTFHWPSNVLNATLVNPSPNGMTVQTFVAMSGNLYAIGAGTYYP